MSTLAEMYPSLNLNRRRVLLTPNEVALGEDCGRIMQKESDKNKIPDKHGFTGSKEESLINDITGQCGTLAACLVYKVPFEFRVNTFKKIADIGKRTEVRTLAGLHYDLFLRPNDPIRFEDREVPGKWWDAIYILVIGKWPDPEYFVCGHILGVTAKNRPLSNLNNDRPPVYRVRQSELTPPPYGRVD